MIDLILTIIPGEWLAGLGARLAAFLGVWVTGRRSGAVRSEKRGLRAEDAKHDRINEADTGIGATDGERIGRLREFADKNRN